VIFSTTRWIQLTPPWLVTAWKYLGTTEIKGKGSHPAIMAMAHRAGGWIKSFFIDDDIPWCALFANGCLDEDCDPRTTGTNSLAADSFSTWGRPLTEPVLGAILVFRRYVKGKLIGHHVGFYLGETTQKYLVRGGNQSDAVTDTWIDKERCKAIRWPTLFPLPGGGPIFLTDDGKPVSVNEG
jgi:uncharacterized protein (TIGR02594 family)